MMKALLPLLLVLLCSAWSSAQRERRPVIMSGSYREHEEAMSEEGGAQLHVFCFLGLHKRFFRLWHSVFLNLSRIPDDLEVFVGQNDRDVRAKATEAQRSFLSFWWSVAVWKKGAIPLAPFRISCVGISTAEPYAVRLCSKVEFFRVVVFFAGVFLFFKAKALSRHIAFYYSLGISVSLVASVALVVLILHRFIPFRRGFYLLMFISSTTSLAILDYVVTHIEALLLEQQTLLVTYVGVVSSVSFAVLYYFSPKVLNPRSYNLVQWGLQAIGLLCLFFSSQIPEVACAVIAGLLLCYNFPRTVIYRFRAYWHRWFPKPRRFVSEEEYREIVAEATKKALDDLREFARSPKCESWKLVGRLRSPTRFASFVEGDSHVTDAEEELHTAVNGSVSSVGPLGDDSFDAANDSDDSLEFHQNASRRSQR